MPPVPVEIQPRPAEKDTATADVQVIEDLEEIVESTMCSCNAGDDNPY
jgi:hypothetical protein